MTANVKAVLTALREGSVDAVSSHRVWIIGGGGAFNGAYLAGVQMALVEAGLHTSLRGVLGVSTSIPALGYMLAATPGDIERHLFETTTYSLEARSSKFVKWYGKTDVRWLRRVFEGETFLGREPKPIVYERVVNSGVRFVGVVTDWETGRPHYIEPTSRDEFFTLIEAGCSMPGLAPPVLLRDRLVCDSVTSDPCPVPWLMSLPETERPTHILFVANAWHEPPSRASQLRSWGLMRRFHKGRVPQYIIDNFALRHQRFYRGMAAALARNDVTVAVAWLPWQQRPLERNAQKIEALTMAGYQTFRELINQAIS